ncbi:MAG: hypothetical protein H7Y32_03365 [Chloroflexales bacterium]|nr:hypothetical protein [Chloroflexales bacterium]
MQRVLFWLIALAGLAALGALALQSPTLRSEAKVLLGLEAPPQLTPLAIGALPPTPAVAAAQAQRPTRTLLPTAAPTRAQTPKAGATATATATTAPTVVPSPAPVVMNGRVYDAYIPAAVKKSQLYQYTCEFDAAWVVAQTFGIDVSVDELIARVPHDTSVEPRYVQTRAGFVIYGGDIRAAYSGDYRRNFLARSTGAVFVPLFEELGLQARPVGDRAGVEAALRRGALVWMKTTVDFKPWRPATWITPDGAEIQTVLGNDHAVVAIGFNGDVVVIRDVLGPTSSNRRRPLEYEVSWDTFMRAWGAQAFDGLAVAPPVR